MILELKVKNFRSIKDWQSFSMLGERKVKEHPNSVIETEGYNILSSAIVYGRNASGKSNLLTAFDAVTFMVLNSAELKLDDAIPPYEPYKLDKANINQPVEFSIDFIAKDQIRYIYSFGYSKTEIHYENLKFYPKSQPAILFERVKGRKIKFGEYLTGRKKEIENLLYANQLFLSKIGTERIDQLESPYRFLTDHLFVSRFHDTKYDNALIRLFTNKLGESKSPDFLSNINRLLTAADTGIEEVTVKEQPVDKDRLPEDMTEEQKDEFAEKYKYRIRTKHKQFDNEKAVGSVEFQLKEESTGTVKLLVVGGLIIEALGTGQTLVVDELDKSLHPMLTRELIKIFNNPKTNPKHAQLIFASHDVSLLDLDLFRRDQIWFSEKEFEGNSHYYSLSQVPGVRANVPIEKWYMSGRLGATPVINDRELEFTFS